MKKSILVVQMIALLSLGGFAQAWEGGIMLIKAPTKSGNPFRAGSIRCGFELLPQKYWKKNGVAHLIKTVSSDPNSSSPNFPNGFGLEADTVVGKTNLDPPDLYDQLFKKYFAGGKIDFGQPATVTPSDDGAYDSYDFLLYSYDSSKVIDYQLGIRQGKGPIVPTAFPRDQADEFIHIIDATCY